MLFSQIADILNGQIERLQHDEEVSDLIIDSRQIFSGSHGLFFCFQGTQHDGHDYLDDVYNKGVRSFITSREVDIPAEANIIRVSNSLEALQKLAAYHRSQFAYPVIGIAGSNGKTMVKEWLSTVLLEKYQVVKSPKSYNSQVGVPLSVWQMEEGHNIAVFEAGISRKGEMEKIEKIIRPTIGIFTNIGEAHSQGFDSLEQKIAEKGLLYEGADKIICCKDYHNIYSHLVDRFPGKVIAWSETENADISVTRKGSTITVTFQGNSFLFDINFQSAENLENMMNVISTTLVCGLQQTEIERGLSKIVPVPMRLELKRGVNDTYLLDDTYNNDLAGLRVALNYQQQQTQYVRKTVILSDILQSGQQDEELYKEVNDLLERHQVYRLIGVGKNITRSKDIFKMEKHFFSDVEQFLAADLAFSNEMILIKGARSFGLEKIASFLAEKNHGTVLEVNFEALLNNLSIYRKHLNPGVQMMVMVKAFAYGGGIAEIANLLQYQQVDRLGVAYVDEGVFLRKHGIKVPILVMNPDRQALPLLTSFDLEAEVYSLSRLKQMISDLDKVPEIHLKIETGMHRLGFQDGDLDELIEILLQHPEIVVKGIFSHLSSQEDEKNDAFTREQVSKFEYACKKISEAIGYRPTRHLLNSAGIIRWPDYQYEMVRLGIGLYGFDACGQLKNLQTVSTFKSVVSQVKPVKAGDSIGYARSGRAEKDGKIAILPVGYADGFLRVFGNGNAFVKIGEKKAPTIGNICMDMTMVDVTGLDVQEGEEVILFGENPSITDLARWANTIPYEILTNIGQRVKRVFKSE